ncbi:MAG: PHB depolymerase family esterase [Pseudomonadota bacterium]
MISRILIAAAGLLLVSACGRQSVAVPATNAPTQITVSGLSSGGYMAGQLHLAHSDVISGVGILAAGPYRCSQGNLLRALGACVTGEGLDATDSVTAARQAAADGGIADPGNLADDRVWLYHGSNDTVVNVRVTDVASETYAQLGVDPTAIVRVTDVPSAHGFPAQQASAPCGEMRSPFVNDCGYDGAGELLQFLTDQSTDVADTATGVLETFEQQAPEGSGFAAQGFIYRPAQCVGASCGLHIVLHGCGQGASYVGDAVAQTAGYNRWADALDLVIIYPQIAPNAVSNPLGCWDWWGYTGAAFATRDGIQVQTLRAIIERYEQAAL